MPNRPSNRKVTKTGKVEIDSPLVAEAAKYLVTMWPDLVEKADMTPADIAKAIIARLPSLPSTPRDLPRPRSTFRAL
jgi:hypothetical protein